MQHEQHRVPVTAAAFFQRDIILAGEGIHLHVYAKDSVLLKRVRIFESQAIHGIVVDDAAESTVLVWGAAFLRLISLDVKEGGQLGIVLGGIQNVGDWILDAAFAPLLEGQGQCAALVTAHNALWMAETDKSPAGRDVLPSPVVERVIPGSNCISYSAHVTWLSPSRCLIASGTAFGDIIVWSATFYKEDGNLSASSQAHYTFSAHEGSVFGVQISSPPMLPDDDRARRVIASCSDDRNIKLWDISDLTTASLTPAQVQRDTGFGSLTGSTDIMAPSCLAKVMGHVSRIWHVRFVSESNSSLQRILSFGEDASMITWMVKASDHPSNPPYTLENIDVTAAHSGKNIWSVALNEHGDLATGGADGAIALHCRARKPEPISEIPCTLLDGFGNGDNFRAYGFVDANLLLSSTDNGRTVLVDMSHSNGSTIIKQISDALYGLQGYSVVTSVPGTGTAFVAGTDGSVLSYVHPSQHLCKVAEINRKVAGLFACQYSTHCVALLISSVGATTAELILLRHNSDTGTMQSVEKKTLSLPSSFIVTSFTFRIQGQDAYAILCSRTSSLAVYRGLASDLCDTISPLLVHGLVHGKEAITAIYWMIEECSPEVRGWLFSTGRDGTLAVHHVATSDGYLELKLMHQLLLPFGPNIEGLHLSPQDTLQVWGFKNKHFVVYDVSAQIEIMTVDCGGAHRSWTFQPSEAGGTFIWTKASKLYRKSQSLLPYELLSSGGHGREIKSVAVSPSWGEPQIIATGAEDTNIKLFKLDKGTFKCLQTLEAQYRHSALAMVSTRSVSVLEWWL